MSTLILSLLPLAIFAFVSSITPGPNNIMMASSGMVFGVLRSRPHLLGINIGFGVLLLVCALGVGQVMLSVPHADLALKLFASVYLLYLAWGLRSIVLQDAQDVVRKPMSFMAAAMFQFVNPKAWVMAITGTSAFLPPGSGWSSTLILCAVFCLINLPCVGLWAVAGASMRRALAHAHWRRAFSAVMVVLTIYAAVSIWF